MFFFTVKQLTCSVTQRELFLEKSRDVLFVYAYREWQEELRSQMTLSVLDAVKSEARRSVRISSYYNSFCAVKDTLYQGFSKGFTEDRVSYY